MPLVPESANYAPKVKTLIKQHIGLTLSAIIGFFFASENPQSVEPQAR
ncbi:MAG TPA: hypothetical protein VFL34_05190 [Candidatus Sulfotelmatobacter sp.]|nr:hypothetical protein [Candidatus Sulfotelmatobacter sp.]